MSALTLSHRVLRVTADGRGDHPSLTAALLDSSAGDVVVAGPGVYSTATTKEEFPLYVPTGVLLEGQGEDTIIDGAGWGRLSNRPLNPFESLVLLGDRSSLQNLTVRNGGGNGVAHEQAASFRVTNCHLSGHGQHGLLLHGPENADIVGNTFLNNGKARYQPPPTPLPAPARQGHHIYFEGMAHTRNRVNISSNDMRGAFADAVAVVPLFDEPENVSIELELQRNTIDGCERNGLTLAGSYGTDRARVRVNIGRNVIRNCGGSGISAAAIFPLLRRPLRDAVLDLLISGNVIEKAVWGIDLVGGFSPAEAGVCHAVISQNQIRKCSKNGILLATAFGEYHLPTANHRLTASILDNQLADISGIEMEFFAYQRAHAEPVTGNELHLSLSGNSSALEQIVLHEDPSGQNPIHLQDGSQALTRKTLG